jgi:hypothetical protein
MFANELFHLSGPFLLHERDHVFVVFDRYLSHIAVPENNDSEAIYIVSQIIDDRVEFRTPR